jgi:hypothetical protein
MDRAAFAPLPAVERARKTRGSRAPIAAWLLLLSIPLNLALPFALALERAQGGVDDNLNLLLAGLATLDPGAHRARWEEATRAVDAAATPGDRGLRDRWRIRGEYALNYRLSTLPVGVLAHAAAPAATATAAGPTTGEIAARALPLGLAIAWAACAAVLVAAIWSAPAPERVALGLGIALASLVAALVGEHPHGEAVAFVWGRSPPRAVATALSHLASPGEFGFTGFSPRAAASLVVAAAFVLRWTGRAGWAWATLALCAAMHAVNALLVAAAFVALDLVRAALGADLRGARVPASLGVACATLLQPALGWADAIVAAIAGAAGVATALGVASTLGKRWRKGEPRAVHGGALAETAALVAVALAGMPLAHLVFDLSDYGTYLTAGLVIGRFLGLLALPAALAVALAATAPLARVMSGRSGVLALALAVVAASAPPAAWALAFERPARSGWSELSRAVDRSLARILAPQGIVLGRKEPTDEVLWYSAMADDVLRGRGAMAALGPAAVQQAAARRSLEAAGGAAREAGEAARPPSRADAR